HPPVLAAHPAEPVAGRRELHRLRRLELEAEPAVELRLDPVDAAIVDRVLESGVHPVAAVAEIALNADDVLGHGNDVLRLAISDRGREPRIRLRIAVRHAEAAAD